MPLSEDKIKPFGEGGDIENYDGKEMLVLPGLFALSRVATPFRAQEIFHQKRARETRWNKHSNRPSCSCVVTRITIRWAEGSEDMHFRLFQREAEVGISCERSKDGCICWPSVSRVRVQSPEDGLHGQAFAETEPNCRRQNTYL